jgi:hypothetical protein
MNIKGLIPGFVQINDVRNVENIGKSIKSDETHDRDANGQQTFDGNQNEQHEPMNQEQLEKAMEHLRNLPAFKEHKWTVHLEVFESARFVLVKDNLGSVIRRIPEKDLWTLPSDNSPRGQLLKRSA